MDTNKTWIINITHQFLCPSFHVELDQGCDSNTKQQINDGQVCYIFSVIQLSGDKILLR
jgi:hypothetical protein